MGAGGGTCAAALWRLSTIEFPLTRSSTLGSDVPAHHSQESLIEDDPSGVAVLGDGLYQRHVVITVFIYCIYDAASIRFTHQCRYQRDSRSEDVLGRTAEDCGMAKRIRHARSAMSVPHRQGDFPWYRIPSDTK